ncbi:RNA 2',3'-cyclic phosphodiesterase [Halodurantibacterium flavum]|uniref:RNA 2',3'-cyclic phosphodiesterase n=1 Tax=Halodurantibacterium flavum TaxID=1382802 RepID=A0ABW4S921_9RHOB
MIRAFVALDLPQVLRSRLAILSQMLPLPRREPEENYHLTLCFLGEVPEPLLEDVHYALEGMRAGAVDLRLSGVDSFGDDRPRLVYAGVAPDDALAALQKKVVTAVRRAGCELERRRFVPHVTLGRFAPEAADLPRLRAAMVQMAGFGTDPVRIEELTLFQSHLGRGGAHYEPLARYPLH